MPPDIVPGDVVDWPGIGQFVVVDTSDHRDAEYPDDLFCSLRFQDSDPRRNAAKHPDGSDWIVGHPETGGSPRAKDLTKIGHI
jgi:hypothetical protein